MASYRFDTTDDPAILRRRRLAEALLQEGLESKPIEHWTQGVGKIAKALVGGYGLRKADQAERAGNERLLTAMLGGQTDIPSPTTMPGITGDVQDYGQRISGIESGGKYDALGPMTKTGDRAYGKYQVMGANVPEWSEAALGQRMTPEQFIANPQAQDKVFQHRFGQYAQKYGPEGAARAWFAGEGGMNDLGRKDQLGTTVAEYGQRFAGQTIPPQAQAQIRQLWNAGPQGRQLAMQIYTQYVKPPEPTTDVRNFQYAQQDPKFKEYLANTKSGLSLKTNPDGSVELVQGPGAGKAFTEAQSKDIVFVTRATGSLPKIDAMGNALTSLGERVGGEMPVVGNYLKSPEYQQAEQAGKEFLQAILRKDTGAAITKEETEEYGSVYLPRPGDSPETLAQKQASRRRAVEAIRLGLPPAAILALEKANIQAPASSQAPADTTKVRRFNPATGKIE